MKRLVILLCIGLGLAIPTSAQTEMDFGINLIGANYLGEIGGYEGDAQPWILDMNINHTQWGVGGFYRYSFSRNIAAKISLNFMRIEGQDSLSNAPARKARNLSFRTDIFEAIITGEYNVFTMNDIARRSRQRVDFKTYVSAGIGAIYFVPYGQFEDEWYSLRPLQTEGEENAYDEIALVVPMSVGADFTFNRKLRVGMEIGYRFAFTDYLDDVSTDYPTADELPFAESFIFTSRSDEAYARGDADLPSRNFYGIQPNQSPRRGNPENNDGYLTIQISCAYVIKGKSDFSKPRYNSIINRRRKRTKF